MENDHTLFNDDFRRMIKQERLARNWTQEQLAEKVDSSVAIVKKWEAGTRGVSLASRQRLCEVLDLEAEWGGCSANRLTKNLSREDLPTEKAVSGEFVPGVRHEKINRQVALARINVTWIEGVLRQKVKPAQLLTLSLVAQPDLVANPWAQDVPETRLPARALPADTALVEVYDQTRGGLLLLGEGGAGKTTLTLELGRMLLKRAFQHEDQPLPFFFPLASWANRQAPLDEWLLEEMETRYGISPSVGRAWLKQHRMILLLDGLDEIDLAYRDACVRAINTFGRVFHTPIVLNSRLTDYTELAVRAELFAAIVVQPLSDTQITEYLAAACISRKEAHKALPDDPGLMEMIRSPLMLSIITQMYQENVEPDIRLTGTPDEKRRQVLVRYVQHLFERRKVGRYTWERTQHWLTYLARQMQQHNQVEFHLERIQPDWLPEGRVRTRYQHTAIRLIYGLQISLVGMLFAWVRGGARTGNTVFDGVSNGLFGLLGAGPGNSILSWMAKGFGGGVEGGGSFCILLTLVFILLPLLLGTQKHAPLSVQSVKQGLLKGVSTGLKTFVILALVGIPLFGSQGGLAHGLQYGLGAALFCGLVLALTTGVITTLGDGSPGKLGKKERLTHFVDASVVSVCAGICFGLVDLALHLKFSSVLSYSIVATVYFVIALTIGGVLGLLRGVGTEIHPSERVSWAVENVQSALGHNLIKGTIIGLSLTVLMSTVLSYCSATFYGWNYGARYGMIYGLIIGLSGGFVAVLGGVLNTVWLSDLLEIKQLIHPNEGIRRTLKNAFLAAAICGPLGGLFSGLISGAAFGWVGGLAGWWILSGGLMVIWIILFSFEFWLIYGGQAWIQHYLLRFALWRRGDLPLDVIAFLDFAAERLLLYKVRGGYFFAHRIVAEYFAALPNGEQVVRDEEDSPSH